MKGKLFLIVGPSGAGKGTLVNRLKKDHPEYFFPPSATTRESREGEREGAQYYFLTEERFKKLEENDGFIETAIVHEMCHYGTLKQPIMDAIEAGQVVIREVDIQGLVSIREKLDKDLFTAIFISPPSLEILKNRILRRQPDMEAGELEHRLESVNKELDQREIADYEVVSEEDEIDKLVREVEEIIEKETKLRA